MCFSVAAMALRASFFSGGRVGRLETVASIFTTLAACGAAFCSEKAAPYCQLRSRLQVSSSSTTSRNVSAALRELRRSESTDSTLRAELPGSRGALTGPPSRAAGCRSSHGAVQQALRDVADAALVATQRGLRTPQVITQPRRRGARARAGREDDGIEQLWGSRQRRVTGIRRGTSAGRLRLGPGGPGKASARNVMAQES